MVLTLLSHIQDCIDTGTAAMAAAQPEQGLRWFDRAVRLAPNSPNVSFLHAAALMLTDAAAALDRLNALVERWPEFREAHFAAVAATSRSLGPEPAAFRLTAALHRFALPAHPDLHRLACHTAWDAAAPGWISLDAERSLTVCVRAAQAPGLLEVRQGGTILHARALRAGECYETVVAVARAAPLRAMLGNAPLLGSNLSPALLLRMEALLMPAAGGRLRGHAWMPGAPESPPVLTLRVAGATDRMVRPTGKPRALPWYPVAKVRAFSLPVPTGALPGGGAVHVLGPGGADIPGSPVFPRAIPPPRLPAPRPGLDVIIPVVRGAAELRACLASLRGTLPAGARIVVVDDGAADPALQTLLRRAASHVTVLRHPVNRGYPAAINTGLRHAAGRDVVLLNADTLLPPGWIGRLADAAYAAPDIGSATPLSNEASILSYPDPAGGNPALRGAALRRMDRLCQTVNAGCRIDVPTAIGFCMYVRADCLAVTGGFREDVFAQGYGEENDWCRRAASQGWRHVAAADVFVSHVGGSSFGSTRAGLMTRNRGVLNRLHPGYDALVRRFLAKEGLAAPRRRLDMARWSSTAGAGPLVLLISHDRGGGVEAFLRGRCQALQAEGCRTLVLRPAGRTTVRLEAAPALGCPNLRFDIPREWGVLAAWLASQRVERVELHHLLDHPPGIDSLAGRFGVPFDIYVHDAMFFCPRVTMLGRAGRYCGEPRDIAVCDACVAELGSVMADPPPVATLRAQSRALFAAANTVIVPCQDVARRVRRYTGVAPSVRPWQDDDALPPRIRPVAETPVRVAVVGSLNQDKGMDVLRDCARVATRRRLPIQFVLIGSSADDGMLLDAGVFVTGRFAPHEIHSLMQREQPTVGFVPSVVPETWCYAMSALWEAGLDVLGFDIGAQAERIRGTGRGRVIPAGVSPDRVLTALLAMHSSA